MQVLLTFLLLDGVKGQIGFKTKFEQTKGSETVTYREGIQYFQKLAEEFPSIHIQEFGETDSGFPLHLVIFSADQDFDFNSLHQKQKKIIMVNNAIHPGEPDGVDASMMFLRDLALDKKASVFYKDIVLVVVPFYNIGGALNRNSTTRVNQHGPVQYGFRGNAQNLDLNRDFIKLDSKNAQSFTKAFHMIDPDVFVDNHVSNGADYQYVMTMLETQPNKLGGALGNYLKTQMIPKLKKRMLNEKFEMAPYVNVYHTKPDLGFNQFLDLPRYSSGYTTLFHTLGLVPETHMLKPYKQRVEATYAHLRALLQVVAEDGEKIQQLREETKNAVKVQQEFVIDWKLDTGYYEIIQFKGYEGKETVSKVTGQKRLLYDRKKPFEKPIPFYNRYIPTESIIKPQAYIVPRGWYKVIERLLLNKVAMQQLEKDSVLSVEVYHIADYKTFEKPYEGHYLHYGTKVTKADKPVKLLKGDYIIYTNQEANRYLVETLEPTAPDSFFNWNFFDSILQQKEGFSDYVFEDLAWEILQENPLLKQDFEAKKIAEPKFKADGQAQLQFIYENSPHYEEAFLRYPIFRLP